MASYVLLPRCGLSQFNPVTLENVYLYSMKSALNYRYWQYLFGVGFLWTMCVHPASAQSFRNAKYGGDFLSLGAGARGLAMGEAQGAVVHDGTSPFWNVAGLSQIDTPETIWMRSERFGGILSRDYVAFAYPIEEGRVFAISWLRQGVNGVQNTLNAWDPDRQSPIANASGAITTFNVSDQALFLSYGQPLDRSWFGATWSTGASIKWISHTVGPFANAWGTGLDAAIQGTSEQWSMGLHVNDLFSMLKFWRYDAEELAPLETVYGDVLPSSTKESVRPSARLSIARSQSLGEFSLQVVGDVVVHVENRQAYNLNLGGMSFEPYLGFELTAWTWAHLRWGLSDLVLPQEGSATWTPAVGLGIETTRVVLDYAFTDFSGYASDLGVTHRISLKVAIPELRKR